MVDRDRGAFLSYISAGSFVGGGALPDQGGKIKGHHIYAGFFIGSWEFDQNMVL